MKITKYLSTAVLAFQLVVQMGTGFALAKKWFKSQNNIDYYIEQVYKFTWFEAFIQCSQRNMSLLTLETLAEHNDVAEILLRNDFKFHAPHLWIGGVGENRKFSWIANSQPIVSSKWLQLNPDNWNNEELCIHFWENTTHLNDRRCDLKYGFICEENQYASIHGDDGKHKYKQIVLNFNNKQ